MAPRFFRVCEWSAALDDLENSGAFWHHEAQTADGIAGKDRRNGCCAKQLSIFRADAVCSAVSVPVPLRAGGRRFYAYVLPRACPVRSCAYPFGVPDAGMTLASNAEQKRTALKPPGLGRPARTAHGRWKSRTGGPIKTKKPGRRIPSPGPLRVRLSVRRGASPPAARCSRTHREAPTGCGDFHRPIRSR